VDSTSSDTLTLALKETGLSGTCYPYSTLEVLCSRVLYSRGSPAGPMEIEDSSYLAARCYFHTNPTRSMTYRVNQNGMNHPGWSMADRNRAPWHVAVQGTRRMTQVKPPPPQYLLHTSSRPA